MEKSAALFIIVVPMEKAGSPESPGSVPIKLTVQEM